MDDKYTLASVGIAGLVVYGVAAMHYGFNGSTATLVISAVVGIVAGTVGFIAAKKL